MDDPFPTDHDLFPLRGPWRSPGDPAELTEAPPHLAPWLTVAGSLSEALRAACPEELSLCIHRRLPVRLPDSAAPVLERPQGDTVNQREVWLLCGDCRVVFARSWIPDGVLPDPGEYPLGDRLFEPGTLAWRLRLEVAPVTGPGDQTLWARRSLHRTPQGRLLVGEVFLPGMERLCTRAG